jgi:hypothetical protein
MGTVIQEVKTSNVAREVCELLLKILNLFSSFFTLGFT